MLQNEAHVKERIRKYGLFEIYNLIFKEALLAYEWKYEKATSDFVKSQTWLIFSNSFFYKKGDLRVGFAETT